MEKELTTRQFRKQPFCWQEKEVLRLLKKKYNKRTLPCRRSVYLALTEIESDFGKEFIKNYTKTIATYAGINRHLASKVLKEFEELRILKLKILRDEKGKFCGKSVYLLSKNPNPVAHEPPVGEPPVGEVPHKKIVSSKEDNNYKETFTDDEIKNNSKRYRTMTAGFLDKLAMTDHRGHTEAQEDASAELRPSSQKSWQERNEETRAFKAKQEKFRNANI